MCFINLALPLFLIEEPLPPKKNVSKAMDKIMGCPIKAIPEGFTIWDRIVLKGPMKIGEIMEYFKKEYESTLAIMSVGELCIFNSYTPVAKKRLGMTPDEVVSEILKEKVTRKYIILEIVLSLIKDDNISVSVPTIQYML